MNIFRRAELGHKLDESVVPRIAAGPPCVQDLHALVGSLLEADDRPAVEDERDLGVELDDQSLQLRQQSPGRAVPITPPSVGAGSDHVHAVDHDVLRDRVPLSLMLRRSAANTQ